MSEETKVDEGQEPVTDTRSAEKGRGQFVKTISVTYERKFNLATGQPLDNYESVHLGFTCWADREEGSDVEQDLATLWELAREQVKAQALPMLKARNEKRKELAETRKAAIPKRAQPAQPPAPVAASPPSAPTQAGPPPPPTTGAPPPAPGQAAAPATGSDEVYVENIDFMRITMPKDKSQVEFWRKGRDYPEVRWPRSGAKLLEIAPVLAETGWVAAHFDAGAVGQEYHRKMKVFWSPSPKNPKWRDLKGIELIHELVQEA